MITIQENHRSAVIYMLFKVMAADSPPDRREYLYILNVAHAMGMTTDDILNLTAESMMQEIKLPADERERMVILYYLLFMMDTDGVVSEEEERIVKDLGYHLGFRIDLVSDLIQVIKSYDHETSPSEALMNRIRQYLN